MKNVKTNNGNAVIKEGKKWVNNKLNKLLKSVKAININIGIIEMKYLFYSAAVIAFAIIVNAGVNAYAIHEGRNIDQDININLIKMETSK